MHELALASEIVKSVAQLAFENKAQKVTELRLELGVMSGIEKEVFDFCFDMAAKNTILEGAKLSVDEIPLKVRCQKCFSLSNPEVFNIICENCQSNDVEILTGKELKILNMEVQ
jgi:hydrogenase nickel incorporation protein HypA/HybF